MEIINIHGLTKLYQLNFDISKINLYKIICVKDFNYLISYSNVKWLTIITLIFSTNAIQSYVIDFNDLWILPMEYSTLIE